MHNINPI